MDFHAIHAQHIASAWWKAFAHSVRVQKKWKCDGCGQRGWIVDHKRYYLPNGKLIFGYETFDDVRLLCNRCNTKGVRTDAQVKQRAKENATVDWWVKWLSRLCFALPRLIWWLIKRHK